MAKQARWLSWVLVLALLAAALPAPAALAQDEGPRSVAVAGTLQSELGCDGDWMPACEKTFLTYDEEDGVWQGVFNVQPGDDQDGKGSRYKAALNGGWDENYGLNAQPGGADIPLGLVEPREVKFYYDHATHWITDNFNTPIFTAAGDFQTQLGCAANDDPSCLRAWLQDPQGSGAYSFSTAALKAGTYTLTLYENENPAQALTEPQTFTVANDGDELYVAYTVIDAGTGALTISAQGAPKGNLSKQMAVWVSADTLMWEIANPSALSFQLYYSPEAALTLSAAGVEGGQSLPLAYTRNSPGGDILQRNPYLSSWAVLKLDRADPALLRAALKGQLALAAYNAEGKPVDATGVQAAGALDELFPYDGPLGVTVEDGVPVLRVWAPTAQSVRLHLFSSAAGAYAEKLDMAADEQTGVWSIQGQPDWLGKYYLYEVTVFVPSTGKIETNLVTDPYSLSLSINSLRSQIVDLNDAALKPQGWDAMQKPALAAPEDIVLYELHIRDFSVNDPGVPEDLRGTYAAFTLPETSGMRHLASLAQAGLTHVHLLPAFDIASVDEDKSRWRTADFAALAAHPPDSTQQASAVSLIKGSDGFNWGYDPYHYTVPEGSYAVDPEGSARIREFRGMVAGLNDIGLRVVMDVVYNHTSESSQNPKSVLDKIVPGYYYRLNNEGRVETSTCCQNTASEHRMMEKLIVDSVVTWAKAYKVDGFRFDLMGHHMLRNMQAVRAALDALTLEADGVDGKSIYVYGEGWDFGEVAKNARGLNASQLNLGGTGIGSFNDRLRDGVRGGSPFTDPREQGYATGLLLAPNAAETRNEYLQRARFNDSADWIKLGLAGNLAEYPLVRANGDTVVGRRILYNSAPAAYTLDPQENIVYVSAHDNETLFDAVQLKAPADLPLDQRIRMNNLALSFVMFSQGVPFFHAGDDLLRSKSLDRNSYDSGDWFNRVDWSLQESTWGSGLPADAGDRAGYYTPLLADPALKPGPEEIGLASAVFREYLQIRKSSPLFRLSTAEDVQRMLTFYNSGKDQIPGLIVMRLEDVDNIDPAFSEVLVLFNATADELVFAAGALAEKMYQLHPVLSQSADAVVRGASYDPTGAFSLPGRTTAVFVVMDTRQSAGEPTAPPAEGETQAPPAVTQPAPAQAPASARTGLLAGGALVVLAGLAGAVALLLRRKKR